MTREDIEIGRALDVITVSSTIGNNVEADPLPADSNRVGVSVAIYFEGTIDAGGAVMVGPAVGAVLAPFGRVTGADGDRYYSIAEYGSLITGPIRVRNNCGGNVTVVTRAYRLLPSIKVPE